ncbi:hypothetical protein PF010_g1708 [Phytophthora fragariae]|uniref:HTH psq-type domain-containing protein n=1 Tax=Phytophthora fragariae TaxID=53985 RepID=A0A6G0M0V4_9STRA|nr:hypothetical protein PF003_g22357 [Phytophthora fragariae]KAE9136390.1 hypothetical protein PF010_g1708 [Phytophthora fragariae]
MVHTYPREKKQAVIAQVQEGDAVVDVAATSGVHERTIRKWLATAKEGRSLSATRPGSKPFFHQVAEQHLDDWASAGISLIILSSALRSFEKPRR